MQNDEVDVRLADLRKVGGDSLVRRMLSRFEQHLADALTAGESVWTRSFAHRTAGLAGMMGFNRLASVCRVLDGDPADHPRPVAEAIAATRSARRQVLRKLATPPDVG